MSAILPLIAGIFNFRKLSDSTRIILVFVCISFLIDMLNFIVAQSSGNNSILVNIYSFLQTLFIGYYFLTIPRVGSLFKRWHTVLLCIALIGMVGTHLLSGSIHELNINAVSISSIMILFHSGFYLIELMKFHIDKRLASNPHFFISSSLLIYHSCVIAIFLTYGYFDYDISEDLWYVKLVAYILFNIFIVVALLTEGKRSKNIES